MPRYNPAIIEPKWQKYWEEQRTFAAPKMPLGQKLYVLDMFPYPSGDGLHVGHPEGYTATDIVCRFERMRGKSVLHPMGFDAFGLPAEEHAIKTGTPPRVGTERNIGNFRRQLKMLGFSYDWDRELATTDREYFRWTQWIFLQLFDTWFDRAQQKGRPLSELPIPADVRAAGPDAAAKYQDEHRLAYQSEAPVNWCPALGTVLANEEVVGGLSERGHHPVVRIPLRQWMLRITAYADRLEKDLDGLDWPESIKTLQRNWIGKSTGAEVDFFIGPMTEFEGWKSGRAKSGFPQKPGDDVLRIYTTRPDTLFGATYMVIAPEHPFVARLTTPDRKAVVEAYQQKAAGKSELDRTELAKDKTGEFTGSYAINPVNGQPIPIWVADYVLISYGTGAIMAVPAHDERDFEFARGFDLPIRAVVAPDESWALEHGKRINLTENVNSLTKALRDAKVEESLAVNEIERIYREGYWTTETAAKAILGAYFQHPEWFDAAFTGTGFAINSPGFDGMATEKFKKEITNWMIDQGLGRAAVNYKLRDWLFSRQRFWGEPFPILHELNKDGNPTGHLRAVAADQLPVDLPELADFKPHGRPEPPLEKAPKDWLYVTIDGNRYKRETNTMPQWAGSCWYYLRFIDPKNDTVLVDAKAEKAWMPVDLYIGGAEHAVLHLLYSRFWHKVLFDRGHVHTPEPFMKLVNQGMILGEPHFHVYAREDENGNATDTFVSADLAHDEGDQVRGRLEIVEAEDGTKYTKGSFGMVEVPSNEVYLKNGVPHWKDARGEYQVTSRAEKMSKSRGNVVNPDLVVKEYGADSLRLYEMFMGPLEATKPWSMTGVNGVRGFLDRVWRLIVNDRAEQIELNAAVQDIEPTEEQSRLLHKTIDAVTRDIERLEFNTAIAKMMEFTNFFTKADRRPRSVMEKFVLLLSPFAPHMAEELWELLDHNTSLAYEPWPVANQALLVEDTVEMPVQVDGKVRLRIFVSVSATAEFIESKARADSRIAEWISGKEVERVVVVPKRLVNFVLETPQYFVEYEFKSQIGDRCWFPLILKASNSEEAKDRVFRIETALKEHYDVIYRSSPELLVEGLNSERIQQYQKWRLTGKLSVLNVNAWQITALPNSADVSFSDALKVFAETATIDDPNITIKRVLQHKFPVRVVKKSDLRDFNEYLLINVIQPPPKEAPLP